jgi:hypothetical protein
MRREVQVVIVHEFSSQMQDNGMIMRQRGGGTNAIDFQLVPPSGPLTAFKHFDTSYRIESREGHRLDHWRNVSRSGIMSR